MFFEPELRCDSDFILSGIFLTLRLYEYVVVDYGLFFMSADCLVCDDQMIVMFAHKEYVCCAVYSNL